MLKTTPFNLKKLLLLQAFAAFGALVVAWVSQYGFALFPCELCMFQRYPYMAIVVVGATVALFAPAKFCKWAAVFCAALFALDAGIAAYHTGVELDFFAGPTACSGGAASGQTLEEMRAAIMNAPLVSCKQAMGYFLGLSMAMWNGFYATTCFILSVVGLRYAK